DPSRAPLDASGGQQQRTALAGTLALEPDLLLLDEPTSMLDPATAQQVREAILEAAPGATLVIAEPHLEPWLPHVDRLGVLRAQQERLRAAGVLPAGPAAPPATRPGIGRQAAAVTASLHRVTVPSRGLTAPLDLELRAGRLTALTGPSGAGKTTVLRTLLGD